MAQRATFQGLSVLLLKFQSDKDIQMHMLYCCGSKRKFFICFNFIITKNTAVVQETEKSHYKNLRPRILSIQR
jgi:hypothetical protein